MCVCGVCARDSRLGACPFGGFWHCSFALCGEVCEAATALSSLKRASVCFQSAAFANRYLLFISGERFQCF